MGQHEAIAAGRPEFRPDRLDLFWWFVCERQRVWQHRVQEGRPPPWTADTILQRNRFTNVYRELDPGTQYALNSILETNHPKPDKIFNVMLYRLIGRSDTHARIGFQSLNSFSSRTLASKLKALRDREGKPVFTAAYMVSGYTNMGSADKVENVARLFGRLHAEFDRVYDSVSAAKSPEAVYLALREEQGFGNFLAYQVLVDLLYPLNVYGGRPLLPFSHDDWAAAGPGARVGISMLLKLKSRASMLEVMRWLRIHQTQEFHRLSLDFPFLIKDGGHPIEISLANIQNCLCEFHKYVKIRDGTGRGRRRFVATVPAPSQPSLLAYHSEAHDPHTSKFRR